MNKMLIGGLGALALGTAAAAAVLYGGFIDVAADSPHSPAVHRLLEFARERAIARASRDIAPPADLAAEERVRRGAGNYDAMCAGCHLVPGVENSEIRRGLYPTPPDLVRPAGGNGDGAQARQFWIIKHGIKASGMPAWSKGGMDDGNLWDLVAFLQQLPALTPAQYRQWVDSSEGHSHGGMDDHPVAKPAAGKAATKAPRHDHAGHRHAH